MGRKPRKKDAPMPAQDAILNEAVRNAYQIARAVAAQSISIRKQGQRYVTVLFPAYRTAEDAQVRIKVFDTITEWVLATIFLPSLINSLLSKDDIPAVKALVNAWVEAAVEVFRAWDDISEGIVNVAEALATAGNRIAAALGEAAKRGIILDTQADTSEEVGSGNTGEDSDGRGEM